MGLVYHEKRNIYIIYIGLNTISRHEPCNVKPITDLKNDDGCKTHLSRFTLWPQTGSWMCCTLYLLQKVDLSIRKRRISRRKPCARNGSGSSPGHMRDHPRYRGICAVYPIKHLYWAWFIHGFRGLLHWLILHK